MAACLAIAVVLLSSELAANDPLRADGQDSAARVSEARGGGDDSRKVGPRSGRVRIEGHSLVDDGGPFLGLGASYFTALCARRTIARGWKPISRFCRDAVSTTTACCR